MKDPNTERLYLVVTNTFAIEQEANKFIRNLTHKYLSHMPADQIQTFSNLKDGQDINCKHCNLDYNAHQFHVNPLAHLIFTVSNICSKHHQVIQIYDYEDCSYTLFDEILTRK